MLTMICLMGGVIIGVMMTVTLIVMGLVARKAELSVVFMWVLSHATVLCILTKALYEFLTR